MRASARVECVVDLVRNLRHLRSAIADSPLRQQRQRGLLETAFPWSQWHVQRHPAPRPMKWGQLPGFALDCMRHLNVGDPYDDDGGRFDQLALQAIPAILPTVCPIEPGWDYCRVAPGHKHAFPRP